MSWGELLLLALTGWTVVGVLGVTVSFRRGEHTAAKRHALWIAAVWLLYLTVLITVSLTAGRRQLSFGQDQCFSEICFAVVRADTMPGYLSQNGEQVVRVAVRMTNRSKEKVQRDTRIYAYLLDAQGRRWQETPGVQGVRMTTPLAPRSSVISEPVFKVSADATDLKLVFTHGRRLPNALVIGDPDGLYPAPVVIPLSASKTKSSMEFRRSPLTNPWRHLQGFLIFPAKCCEVNALLCASQRFQRVIIGISIAPVGRRVVRASFYDASGWVRRGEDKQ